MARMAKDSRLITREARTRLKQRHEPYWKQIHPGLFIGYRKGTKGHVWIVRRFIEGKYQKKRLGVADDFHDANGKDVLDYQQAYRRALDFADTPIEEAPCKFGRYTVKDAADDYLEWFAAHRKSYTTTKQNIDAHILPAFGKREVKNLTAKQIRQWHERLAATPARKGGKKAKGELDTNDHELLRRRKSTANRILTVFKALLNHAWKDGSVELDEAWRRVEPFKDVTSATIDHRSVAECKRLINTCEPDFRDLVQAALLSGCRYGELISLEVRDYLSESKILYARYTKNGKPRHIPLNKEGAQFFERVCAGRQGTEQMFCHADGEPWQKSHQTRRMKDACTRAKIDPPMSFHGLRNTYGALLAMQGVPLKVIAELLGHSDTRITEKHYAHINEEYVAKTLRKNLPSFGIKKQKVVSLK